MFAPHFGRSARCCFVQYFLSMSPVSESGLETFLADTVHRFPLLHSGGLAILFVGFRGFCLWLAAICTGARLKILVFRNTEY